MNRREEQRLSDPANEEDQPFACNTLRKYARCTPNSRQLSPTEVGNLVHVELFQDVGLDQADTVQDLTGQADASIRNTDALLALGEQDGDHDHLEGETEDENTEADEGGDTELQGG